MLCVSLISCKDFITVDPPSNQLNTTTVFEDEITAKSAVLGIYSRMGFGGPTSGGPNGITYFGGLSSDELELIGVTGETIQFSENSLLSTNTKITAIWNSYYEYIYYCNSLIEGLKKSTKLSATIKDQYTGEAMFLRAYSHFYLLNLFGQIPYITSTDYNHNSSLQRLEVNKVYESIVEDLSKAKKLMPIDYSFAQGSRTRANSLAASAFLSKVYLFMGKDGEAEVEASILIDNPLFSLEDIGNTFLTTSKESIWQLSNSGSNDGITYTNDGDFYAGGSSFSQSLTNQLINSFEPGDLRRSNWIWNRSFNGVPIYTPYKYKDDFTATALRESFAMIRLAEIFLIRAEARARQNKIVGANSAASDVNVIRNRAGLSPLPTMTKDETIRAIFMERNHEFFMEMATRWLDLKRSGKATEVLGPLKTDWESTDVLYPIPFEETLVNKNLFQNPGYN